MGSQDFTDTADARLREGLTRKSRRRRETEKSVITAERRRSRIKPRNDLRPQFTDEERAPDSLTFPPRDSRGRRTPM